MEKTVTNGIMQLNKSLCLPQVHLHVTCIFPLVKAILCSICHNPKGNEYLDFALRKIAFVTRAEALWQT
jgi:hypothetical protein